MICTCVFYLLVCYFLCTCFPFIDRFLFILLDGHKWIDALVFFFSLAGIVSIFHIFTAFGMSMSQSKSNIHTHDLDFPTAVVTLAQNLLILTRSTAPMSGSDSESLFVIAGSPDGDESPPPEQCDQVEVELTLRGLNLQPQWFGPVKLGQKDVEVRKYALGSNGTDSFMFLIRTKGKDQRNVTAVTGVLEFAHCRRYNNLAEFQSDSDRHCIYEGSDFYWNGVGNLFAWVIRSYIPFAKEIILSEHPELPARSIIGWQKPVTLKPKFTLYYHELLKDAQERQSLERFAVPCTSKRRRTQ